MTKMLKRVLQDVLSEEENEQLISAFDQIESQKSGMSPLFQAPQAASFRMGEDIKFSFKSSRHT